MSKSAVKHSWLMQLPVFDSMNSSFLNLMNLSSTSQKSTFCQMASPLDAVVEADIDTGRFKYILIKVHHSPDGGPETTKFIVRGYLWAGFHADIYDKVAPAIEQSGLDCECVGGGRINHNPDAKTIEVYGYSQGYGAADHAKSVEILQRKYPDYAKITFSNEGY